MPRKKLIILSMLFIFIFTLACGSSKSAVQQAFDLSYEDIKTKFSTPRYTNKPAKFKEGLIKLSIQNFTRVFKKRGLKVTEADKEYIGKKMRAILFK